jgi:transcription-repair coupling factor (superfamily II helicase)
MIEPLLQAFSQGISRLSVTGLRGASPAAAVGAIAAAGPCCCIVADEHLISIVEQDLRLFSNSNKKILQYPGQEIPPYTPLSPDQRTTATRLSSLYRFKEGEDAIMVTSVEALLRRTMPVQALTGSLEYVEAEEDCDQDGLLKSLNYLGYEKVALVQSVGDYSVRGGIIDIFPPPFITASETLHEGPIRLDFYGDIVDSLRSFDPLSQRSSAEIRDATILPVTDILLSHELQAQRKISRIFAGLGEQHNWNSEQTARLIERSGSGLRFAGMEFFLPLYYQQVGKSSTVLDFFPQSTTLIFLDSQAIKQSMELSLERITRNYQSACSTGTPALPPEELFQSDKQLDKDLSRFKQLHCTDFPEAADEVITISSANHQLLKQNISLQRAKLGLLAPLSEQIQQWQRAGEVVALCCRSTNHTKNLSELLTRYNHRVEQWPPPIELTALARDGDPETLYLCNHPLSSGFSLKESGVHLLSEGELFGEMRLGKKSATKAKGEPIRFTELNEGDIVVHRDHGLGIYQGLATIEFQSVTNDFMLIEYRDGDKLYLPVDRLNLISRYQGLSDREPRIDKLGSQSWKSTTSKVKEEVWKVAHELLNIYARREIKEGRQFSPPGALFRELEESFAFDETPGQAKSIDDVIEDLISDKPMDRLICGDVGYGKTEVAIRAAFKVVEDGFQVAVLVPTTVLAEQHAKTFAERLAGFPVNISCLNRFRTTTEQRRIIKDLGRGDIDIVIGTHRLLSRDVGFNNLGLLIIDEEHRFGVAHKEKLKKMRAEVDILTLTATPIPRTLQMSLLSIRDLSVISTPPEHRRPVKTFVARYDDLVIKEAVSRELRRGGQVFIVHNRVKSIHRMASVVQELVPEAKIAVAHGQMAGNQLEEIMVNFVNKKINVLVATTIIESGLDIPSANTIIINRADMLGLAEIYQLRGRVGRSNTQSFAYLLVPSVDALSRDSRDRLRALMDCNELGGGFKLAMSDLQIRGGGNLLGISQSGNIAAIGYDLYLDLLQKTVAELKAEAASGKSGSLEDIDPEVNLQISAYIPEEYIPDISQRYISYRRIAALTTSAPEMHEDLRDEMVDRYGTLPTPTLNLLRIIALKAELASLRIKKLEQGPDTLVFSFQDDTPISPEMMLRYLQHHSGKKVQKPPKLTPDGRLIVYSELSSIDDIFETVTDALVEFNQMVQEQS